MLWTTRLTLYEALMRPLIPPKANMSMASTCATSEGSFQGSLVNHHTNPRPPRARAPFSREATTLKKVSRLGEKHRKGQKGMEQLRAPVNARVGVLMMDTDRDGEYQKEDERGARHGVAEESASRLFRDHRVPGNVRW